MSDASSRRPGKAGGFPARRPDVPWEPLPALLLVSAAFFGAQFVAAIILGLALRGAGDGWLDSTVGQFLFVLLSSTLVVLAVWIFLRRNKVNLTRLGFGRRPNWLDLGYVGLAYLVYFVSLIIVFSLADAFTPINLEQEQEIGFETLLSPAAKLMAFVSLVVLPPLVEEAIFRGFIFTSLRKRFRFVWATIITSLLFAALHLPASSEGLLWAAGIDTLILSFALCYLREKTGALWACIALHAVKNGIAFAFILSAG